MKIRSISVHVVTTDMGEYLRLSTGVWVQKYKNDYICIANNTYLEGQFNNFEYELSVEETSIEEEVLAATDAIRDMYISEDQ